MIQASCFEQFMEICQDLLQRGVVFEADAFTFKIKLLGY